MPTCLQHSCKRSHRGAANANEVVVHLSMITANAAIPFCCLPPLERCHSLDLSHTPQSCVASLLLAAFARGIESVRRRAKHRDIDGVGRQAYRAATGFHLQIA